GSENGELRWWAGRLGRLVHRFRPHEEPTEEALHNTKGKRQSESAVRCVAIAISESQKHAAVALGNGAMVVFRIADHEVKPFLRRFFALLILYCGGQDCVQAR